MSIDSVFSVLNLTPHAWRREGNKVQHHELRNFVLEGIEWSPTRPCCYNASEGAWFPLHKVVLDEAKYQSGF